jgi:hypothetical protein
MYNRAKGRTCAPWGRSWAKPRTESFSAFRIGRGFGRLDAPSQQFACLMFRESLLEKRFECVGISQRFEIRVGHNMFSLWQAARCLAFSE